MRRYQPELVDQAIEEMLAHHEDLRWSVVVGAYLDEEINLGKAADLLGIHRLELQERFKMQGIPLRPGPKTTEAAQSEMMAIEVWNSEARTNEAP